MPAKTKAMKPVTLLEQHAQIKDRLSKAEKNVDRLTDLESDKRQEILNVMDDKESDSANDSLELCHGMGITQRKYDQLSGRGKIAVRDVIRKCFDHENSPIPTRRKRR